MKCGKKFDKTVLKQPTLNFKANPEGPYNTTTATTSPPLPTTSPPTTTPHEKDFKIITDRLEKMCDNLKEELESKFEYIKENLANNKDFTATLYLKSSSECIESKCDIKKNLIRN